MATSSFSKFFLLLWKNWVIQKRHWVQTFFEIFIPVAFTGLLILFRSLLNPEVIENETYYQPLVPTDLTEFYNKTSVSMIERPFTMDVVYSPKNQKLEGILNSAIGLLENAKTINIIAKENADELNLYLEQTNPWVGVLFPDDYKDLQMDSTPPTDFKFTFRFPSELRSTTGFVEWSNWFTNRMFPAFAIAIPRNQNQSSGGQPPGYYQEGFLPLQYAISRAYTLEFAGDKANEIPDVFLHRYPYKPYLDDPLLIGLEAFIPLIIILSLLYTAINIVKYVAIEKEKQLKEAMKIMGLSNWIHWAAWFVKCYIFLFITASCMVLIFKVT